MCMQCVCSPVVAVVYLYQYTDLERIYVNDILANLDNVMGPEMGAEMRGIANYWNIDVGIILGINIMYETRKV